MTRKFGYFRFESAVLTTLAVLAAATLSVFAHAALNLTVLA